MTKLLMVANSVNKTAERLGFSGSTLRARMLGIYFKNQGFELRILTTGEGAKFFKNNNLDVDFFISSKFRKKISLLLTFITNFIFSIKYLFRIKNVDVIYSTSDLLPDVLFSGIFKLLNRKVIFICGCHLLVEKISQMKKYYFRSLFHQIYSYYSQRIFLAALKKLADLILVSNSIDRAKLIKNGFKEEQVMVAYGAPERKFINEILLKKPTKVYDILFLGQGHPRKGTDILDYVFSKLMETDLKVAVVGWLPQLEKKYKRINNFYFFEILSGPVKYKVISQSRVFIMSSYYESFSLTACEAIACGTPVVAFDTEIFRSIYKKGMIFVPYADKDALYQEIISLLKDKKELQKLSREAFTFGRQFSWERTGKKMTTFIRQSLKKTES